MKVILKNDVHNLGLAGDIKEVRPGFARNFLLPNGLAVQASPAAMADWERTKEARVVRRAKDLAAAKELAGRIEGVSLSFSRKVGEGGKLFGSVGKADVAKSLASSGFTVDKLQIALEEPFKEVGDYEVQIRLRPGVSAKVKVSVVAQA
jgi:large subunit ribosomal protein L9